jgi:hypothetical protein
MRARHTMPCPFPVVSRSDRYIAPDRSEESDRVVVPWNDRDEFVIAHYRLWRIYIQGCCCRISQLIGPGQVKISYRQHKSADHDRQSRIRCFRRCQSPRAATQFVSDRAGSARLASLIMLIIDSRVGSCSCPTN